MKIGMVSVTFRALSPEQIIKIVSKAGLDGIEWGSDIHVPVGDIENAEKIALLTKEAEMEIPSYGSYYRVGESDNFSLVLNTALALGTQNIRVWAGTINSEDADAKYYNKVLLDAKRIAKEASESNVSISFEYHGNTLTNTQNSTVKLLQDIDMPNVFTYWQPLRNTGFEENIIHINQLLDIKKLKNIHAYNWDDTSRLPLIQGKSIWKRYFQQLKNFDGYVLMEFVKDDDVEQFYEDAKVLLEIKKEN